VAIAQLRARTARISTASTASTTPGSPAGCSSRAGARGLELFEDPEKGNCAECHPSRPRPDGRRPLFTGFHLRQRRLPRNARIPANADPGSTTSALCGPERKDLAVRRDLCGAFKVPTLRNVARTAPYFHNGAFATLREAVDFYARRDTHPGDWFRRQPRASGSSTTCHPGWPVP
jgi:cytochrome c peroxidase